MNAPPKSAAAAVVDVKRISELKHELQSVAQFTYILEPGSAEEPILARSVRGAVFEWMSEINAVEELMAVGLTPRRSALLYGPPGTGKTTLAHHLAARLGVPLVIVQSDQIESKFMGETSQNLATLFMALKKFGTSVVTLMDEIDSLGSARATATGSGGERDRNAVVNSLLTRFQDHPGLLIAATNRREALDPALWRRFGMQIEVALPDYEERYAILKRYFAPFIVDDKALTALADLTTKASPSLLRQLAEGVKRKMVLARRFDREIGAFPAVIAEIVASVAPPPQMETPPLWDKGSVFVGLAPPWPPAWPDGGAA